MVGIGYRKEIADIFASNQLGIDFIEVAPENWIDIGGHWKRELKKVTQNLPLFCHGLSLSIGSPDKVDYGFLQKIKDFLEEYDVQIYSEHLSFSKVNNAHLYDLLPIPFTEQALQHVTEKILRVQDFLKKKLILENVSYYTSLDSEMTESEFINSILKRTGCHLLLDVNNIYVNAFNHGYDAHRFIESIHLESVRYIHMAGHYQVDDTLIIDTHGEAIIDPVYELLRYTSGKLDRQVPVLLERDFNFPEIEEFQSEIDKIKRCTEQNLIQAQ